MKNRRSIRLREYDYSQNGLYFVTICVNGREELLGNVENGEMVLNDAGIMVDNFWNKLPKKFDGIYLDEYVVMPNHFHGIIGLFNDNENGNTHRHGRPHGVAPTADSNVGATPCGRPDIGVFQKNGLSGIISWFKTMTTNQYIKNVHENNWPPFY
ncbi:MAG: transposase, partial [bacterium]